jgi:hypothetical protein
MNHRVGTNTDVDVPVFPCHDRAMTACRVAIRLIIPVAAAAAAVAGLTTAPGVAHAAAVPASVPGSVHQVSGLNGCYTADGSSAAGPGTCRNIRGGIASTTIVISPDGRSAYLIGYGLSGGGSPVLPVLSVLSRNPKSGALTQLAGKAGCLSRSGASEAGPGSCTRARDLDTGDATSLVISADGRFLYAASQYQRTPGQNIGGIVIFSRNVQTGALRQLSGKLGCVTADGSSNAGPHTCAAGREADDISNVHITPDQKYLYASNYDGPPVGGIAIFRRNAKTGALSQLGGKEGCITANGTTFQSGATQVCRAMPNIGSPWDVATPGNLFVYVPDNRDNLLQAFRRDSMGGLVPLKGIGACVSDGGSSPLGPNTCVNGRGLFDVERAVLSANTAFIYTNGFQSPAPIAILNRNLKTGMLLQRPGPAGCFSGNGMTGDSSQHCGNGRAINEGYAGILSANGTTLYYAEFGDGLVIFHVNKVTGGLTQLSGKLGCVTGDGSSEEGPGTCQKARAVEGAYQVAIAPNHRDLYLAATHANGVSLFHATP